MKGGGVKKGRGPLSAADSLDLFSLQGIVLEAREDLRTKASQRITVLGQTGVGKSTTLNILLSCTVVSDDEYSRICSQADAQPCKFYRTKYFCDGDTVPLAVRL